MLELKEVSKFYSSNGITNIGLHNINLKLNRNEIIAITGESGSGKSVFLHSLIMSLMYKLSPEELRFIMIDPKRVEFNRYNRMPHLMQYC